MILKYIRLSLVTLYVGTTCFIATILCLLRPFHPDNARLMGRVIGRPVLWLLGIKLETENIERLHDNRPAIFISNHQSNFDIFLCGPIIPARTVSLGKKSLRKIPFFGQMYWLTGNVLIDRANKKSAFGTMDKAVEAVTQKNTTIWMMPEGTRNRKGGIAPFKKGVFYTAIKSQRPLVLICLSRYSDVMDLTKWRSCEAKMTVLEPIDTRKWTVDQVDELAQHCRELMTRALESLTKELT